MSSRWVRRNQLIQCGLSKADRKKIMRHYYNSDIERSKLLIIIITHFCHDYVGYDFEWAIFSRE
jgi:hypothetical protein